MFAKKAKATDSGTCAKPIVVPSNTSLRTYCLVHPSKSPPLSVSPMVETCVARKATLFQRMPKNKSSQRRN